MIVLDTNVLSALMDETADAAVIAWVDGLPTESIWTTTITVFEVRFGLELLPVGRKRRRLEEAFQRTLDEDLERRVLPLDTSSALSAAVWSARRRRAGRPVEVRDAQIAGIAATRKATLATRNTRDFEGADLTLVSPWSVS